MNEEFDFMKGEEAATFGMNIAADARRVMMWKFHANQWLQKQPRGREFTADNLIRDIGLPDEGPNRNNVVGAWFGAQSKAHRIEFANRMHKSSRVDRHVGVHRVWRVL
jgi:hypothetical protein